MTQEAHHLKVTADRIGRYVLLPGDPGRVPVIARYLEGARRVAENREFVTWTGSLGGETCSVVSTGIGGPSAAIALEELTRLGAHTFIRVGTCGCIDPSLVPGHAVIVTGAIRRDGTSLQYLPAEFPALADLAVTGALLQAAVEEGLPATAGICESKDSYYGQHDPDSSPVGDSLRSLWNSWKKGGALVSEMECAALFILSSVRRVRCGAILHIFRNREKEELTGTGPVTAPDVTAAVKTAVRAARLLIEKDRERDG